MGIRGYKDQEEQRGINVITTPDYPSLSCSVKSMSPSAQYLHLTLALYTPIVIVIVLALTGLPLVFFPLSLIQIRTNHLVYVTASYVS